MHDTAEGLAPATTTGGVRRLPRLLLEAAVLFVGLSAYRGVRTLVRDEHAAAIDNAETVVRVERLLGIFTEEGLQDLALVNEAFVGLVNRYYAFSHFPSVVVVLVWLWWRRPDRYGPVRRVLVSVTLAGLVLHVAYPLAPPRWFPRHGFVDTLAAYGPRIYDSDAVRSAANQIAAMPSLHVGWALVVGWAVVSASRSRWRWVAVAHPTAMVLAVVVTANHWWVDAAVAAVLVVVAVTADDAVIRWRAGRRPPGPGRPGSAPTGALPPVLARSGPDGRRRRTSGGTR